MRVVRKTVANLLGVFEGDIAFVSVFISNLSGTVTWAESAKNTKKRFFWAEIEPE